MTLLQKCEKQPFFYEDRDKFFIIIYILYMQGNAGYPKNFIAHSRFRWHRQESLYKKRLSLLIRITSLHILTAIDHTAHGMRYKMIYIALIACVTEKITVLCMTM